MPAFSSTALASTADKPTTEGTRAAAVVEGADCSALAPAVGAGERLKGCAPVTTMCTPLPLSTTLPAGGSCAVTVPVTPAGCPAPPEELSPLTPVKPAANSVCSAASGLSPTTEGT